MKVCGVIAEFNPFHQGHAICCEQARKKTGADVLVVVDERQLGATSVEPAIEQKMEPCKVALQNGVDVVIEMPTGEPPLPTALVKGSRNGKGCAIL